MGRFLRGLIWVFTFGFVDLDPNKPPDFTKDEAKLKKDLADCEAALTAVRGEKAKVEAEVAKLEGSVRAAKQTGEKVSRKVLGDILIMRDEISLLDAREAMLWRKVTLAKRHLGMIELYKDSKPIEVRQEVRDISDRLRVRIDTIAVDKDEAATDVMEQVDIGELQAQLDDLEREIVGDPAAPVFDEPKPVEVRPVRVPDAIRSAKEAKAMVERAPAEPPAMDEGYEPYEDDEDDGPPAREAMPA